jgi:DedD protein
MKKTYAVILAGVGILSIAVSIFTVFYLRGDDESDVHETIVSKKAALVQPDEPKAEVKPSEADKKENELKKAEPLAAEKDKDSQEKKAAPEAKAPEKVRPKTSVAKAKTPAKKALKPWVINVASFSSKNEAEALLKGIKGSGYTAYRTEFKKNGKTWHRIRVGFFSTQSEAKKTARAIESRHNVNASWIVKASKDEAEKHAR